MFLPDGWFSSYMYNHLTFSSNSSFVIERKFGNFENTNRHTMSKKVKKSQYPTGLINCATIV